MVFNNMQAIPFRVPLPHAHICSLPRHLPKPLFGDGLQVGSGDRLDGTLLSLCVLFDLGGATRSHQVYTKVYTKYIYWVSMAVRFCPPEGSSCDDTSRWPAGMAELGGIPDLVVLLASGIIPQSFDCTS